jgi:hypothetical protein
MLKALLQTNILESMTFFSLISNKKDFHLLKEEADKALVDFQNIGRNGNNEDVDNSIVFLLSGKATLVIGSIWRILGGVNVERNKKNVIWNALGNLKKG